MSWCISRNGAEQVRLGVGATVIPGAKFVSYLIKHKRTPTSRAAIKKNLQTPGINKTTQVFIPWQTPLRNTNSPNPEIPMKAFTIAALTLAMLGATAANAQSAKMVNGMLVGPNGMTLYTFDKDTDGKSVCNGPCATNWPPLMAMDSDKPNGDYTIITRDDGKKQWAMKGKPLYYWIKDTKAGDMTGDGVNSTWHVIK
jgi:predicted lipoprotein with Yx(FWY)xxD motif